MICTLNQSLGGGMHHVTIPSDFDLSVLGGGRRALCTINGQVTIHCALNPIKDGGYFIYINKKLIKQLNLMPGEPVRIELKQDTSEYQIDFPEVLREVLDTDPEANERFEALTPGRKRGLAHWVNTVKSIDKKIERSLQLAERLKMGITDPRMLVKKDLSNP